MTAGSPAGEMVVSSTTSHLPAPVHQDEDVGDVVDPGHEDQVYGVAASSSSAADAVEEQRMHVCRRQDSPPDIDSTTRDPVSFSSSSASSSSHAVDQQAVHQQQQGQEQGPDIGSYPVDQVPQQQPLIPFYDQHHNNSLSNDQIYHLEPNSSSYQSNAGSQQLFAPQANHHSHHVHLQQMHAPDLHHHHHHQQHHNHIIRMFHHMDQPHDGPTAGPSVVSMHESSHLPLHADPSVGHHAVWQPQHSAGGQPADDMHLHDHYSEFVSHPDLHVSVVQGLRQQHAQPQQQSIHERDDEEQEIVISDVPVESRARASLPSAYLFIDLAMEEEVPNFNRDLMDNMVYGVFARKTIPERTQFGPVEGVISQISSNMFKNYMYNQHSQQNLIVFISENLILDQSDENKSNWMRFVRAADSPATQNLILVTKEQTQSNPENSQELITTTKFYFMTTRCINPREELRVWYCKDYADRFRLKLLHESTGELGLEPSVNMQSPAADLRFNPSSHSPFYRSSSSAPPSVSDCDPIDLQVSAVPMHTDSHTLAPQHHLLQSVAHPVPMPTQVALQTFSPEETATIRPPITSESSSHPLSQPLQHEDFDSRSAQPAIISTAISARTSAVSECIAAVKDDQMITPSHSIPPVCEQLTISAVAAATAVPDPCLPQASGHKLRNKIAKSQHQQQLQLQQQQKQNAGLDSGRSETVVVPPVRVKAAVQHKCDICGKTFPRCYSLRRHQIMHSGEKKYKCPICSMSFSHVYNRNRHVKRHANRSNGLLRRCAVTPRDNMDSRNECSGNEAGSDCMTDVSATSSDLSDKKENESQNSQSAKCPADGDLNAKSRTSSSLPNGKAFRCPQCYKCFSCEERLSRHALVHTGDDLKKPLACNICGKRFINNSALSCHTKVHR